MPLNKCSCRWMQRHSAAPVAPFLAGHRARRCPTECMQCSGCGDAVTGVHLTLGARAYHERCVACRDCGGSLRLVRRLSQCRLNSSHSPAA